MLEEERLVKGVVVRHEPYGAFVDIGEPELAVLLLDAIVDGDPAHARDLLPAVGTDIEAVLLGYTVSVLGTQPRLSIRPSDLERVRKAEPDER